MARIIKKSIPFFVIAICIYAIYLRITHLHHHVLWGDELFYLEPMRNTFTGFLKAIPEVEVCSYLSGELFLFYPLFKFFPYNKWALAIPCLISTIIGFYLLYLICKKYFKSIWGYIVTFGIVCFNATLINHATEIRMYAFLPTLELATFYLFQRLTDLNFEISALKKAGVITCFFLVIWFQVYGILMFGSCLLYFLLSKCKEEGFKAYFRKAVVFTIVVLAIAMPFWIYCIFIGPHLAYKPRGGGATSVFTYIPNPLYNLSGFLKGIFCNLIGFKKLYFLILGMIAPLIFSYEDRYKQLLFLAVIIIMPLSLIFLLAVVSDYPFIQRYFIWLMPLFAFFLGWTWDSFFIFIRRNYIRRAESV